MREAFAAGQDTAVAGQDTRIAMQDTCNVTLILTKGPIFAYFEAKFAPDSSGSLAI